MVNIGVDSICRSKMDQFEGPNQTMIWPTKTTSFGPQNVVVFATFWGGPKYL